MLYLDTSALAKLYVSEAESAQVSLLVERNQPRLYASRVTYAEMLAVLARIFLDARIFSCTT